MSEILKVPVQPNRFGESQLKGKILAERIVGSNVAYLRELHDLLRLAGSYQLLLSGESSVSNPPEDQGGVNAKRVTSELGITDIKHSGFGTAIIGVDYETLKTNHPNDHYKFYSSFDLTTPEKVEIGTKWFTEVAQLAHERALSLTTKSFDHAYDSLNLYTWHPEGIAEIIQELYPKYEALGLYYETPHFFQGELDGVNPNHVGFVQEPISGSPLAAGGSHSVRMGTIGLALDQSQQQGKELSQTVFIEAAQRANVDPARPYLMAA